MGDNYLSLLNKEQRSAVTNIDGPLLVLAGAGSGKTRVITSRIAYIIKNGYANYDEILAVTFTNKAAKEMVSRVLELTGRRIPWLGTFHAIAAKILRNNSEIAGLKSNFIIIDVSDQSQIIKGIINDINRKFSLELKNIIKLIQNWKEKGQLPSEVKLTELKGYKAYASVALKVYHSYQERLKFLNYADFGDLLLYNIKIFEQNPDALSYYQDKFKYIMVDEYQDTNAIQYLWLKYLGREHSNICCVGDEDQSIYSWRGAEVDNILKFSDNFKNTKTIKLECNYRSTPHILAAASCVIKNNKFRLGKVLWTKNAEGEKVNQVRLKDEKAEAKFISEQILKFQTNAKTKYKFSDIAVLVRVGFQTRVLEESFMKYSIGYNVICGMKFYDHKEIKDIISYLRLIVNNNDDVAFERIVNEPKRSIGTVTLKKIYKIAADDKISYFEAANRFISNDDQRVKKIKKSLDGFLSEIYAWKEEAKKMRPHELINIIANQSGYMKMLEKEKVTGPVRIENIKELIISSKDFDNVTTFLEHISLMSDADNINHNDTIKVMTLHAAKGLEFPCVFLPGWEEGLFPYYRSLEDTTGKALEEERRLAYVGLTRAKERLTISWAQTRQTWNNWMESKSMSRFIEELPKENINVIKK